MISPPPSALQSREMLTPTSTEQLPHPLVIRPHSAHEQARQPVTHLPSIGRPNTATSQSAGPAGTGFVNVEADFVTLSLEDESHSRCGSIHTPQDLHIPSTPTTLTHIKQTSVSTTDEVIKSLATPLASTGKTGMKRWLGLGPSQSSTSTIAVSRTRPNTLPPKTPDEDNKHIKLHAQMMRAARAHELDMEKKRAKTRARREKAAELALSVWTTEILPYWDNVRYNKRTRQLWFDGLPSRLRGTVWLKAVGNPLHISSHVYSSCCKRAEEGLTSRKVLEAEYGLQVPPAELRKLHPHSSSMPDTHSQIAPADDSCMSNSLSLLETCNDAHDSIGVPGALGMGKLHKTAQSMIVVLQGRRDTLEMISRDISRTFPHLGLFQQPQGPLSKSLSNVLQAFAMYRVDLGFVQGMSYLAGMLLVNMDELSAFTALCTIFQHKTGLLSAFYRMDLSQPGSGGELAAGLMRSYFGVWQDLLACELPELSAHFEKIELLPEYYLCEWILTAFTRPLELDTAARVWDLWFRDGDSALFRIGCGILKVLAPRIMGLALDDALYDLLRLTKTIQPYDDPTADIAGFWKCIGSIDLDQELWRVMCRARHITPPQ